jgi:hypothetical protein
MSKNELSKDELASNGQLKPMPLRAIQAYYGALDNQSKLIQVFTFGVINIFVLLHLAGMSGLLAIASTEFGKTIRANNSTDWMVVVWANVGGLVFSTATMIIVLQHSIKKYQHYKNILLGRTSRFGQNYNEALHGVGYLVVALLLVSTVTFGVGMFSLMLKK